MKLRDLEVEYRGSGVTTTIGATVAIEPVLLWLYNLTESRFPVYNEVQ